MTRYEAVVWDWNGTLLDDVDLCLVVVNEILAEYEFPALSRRRYLEIFDFPARVYWERAGLNLGRIDFTEVSARFCELFEAQLSRAGLQLGSLDVLGLVRRAGIRQFLISNTEHPALARTTESYGLTAFFDDIQGMDTGLADGKLPAARLVLERFSLDPTRVLLVGDTTHDAEVARELGAACVLVAEGHQTRSRLQGYGVPVLASLRELSARLAPMLSA